MTSKNVESRSRTFTFNGNISTTINLDEDNDYDSDGTLLGDEFEDRFIRPTPDIVFTGARTVHPDIDDAAKRLDSYSSGGRTFRPGKTVELLDGGFLRITAIICEPGTQEISLRGTGFRRNKELAGLLELKRNEVTMCLKYDINDPRDLYHQSVKSISLDTVRRIRELVKTNQPFPSHSYRELDPAWRTQGTDYAAEYGRLVCRTKLVQVSKSEGWLCVLDQHEADDGFGVEPEQLRHQFRGETEKGGQCRSWLQGEREFDITELKRSKDLDLLHFHRQNPALQSGDVNLPLNRDIDEGQPRYTFGDAFCGAGGTSRGAKGAGLRVDWGFDYDPAAINSYQRNFFGTRCEAIAAHEFVTIIKEDFRVDILHLSPPCQPFSPVHARPGKNDELNQATFFAVEELIRKVKPRIVTLEETFGLIRTLDHLAWFRAMIQVFTKLGFSIRWKVLSLVEFGLPQPRKRLIIFASCPGEALPEFPNPTHCKVADLHHSPNLSRFATVADAISRIPKGFDLHNPEELPKRNHIPYSPDLPLRNTIVCTAQGQRWHPSGTRLFTLREIACLQGFPLCHQFGPIRRRMQMGNAVPPIAAKVLFEHIKKELLRADGLL